MKGGLLQGLLTSYSKVNDSVHTFELVFWLKKKVKTFDISQDEYHSSRLFY